MVTGILLILAAALFVAVSFGMCYLQRKKAKELQAKVDQLQQVQNAFVAHQKQKHKAFRERQEKDK